ncbi:phosphonate C-P lyase system protein PhnH [Agreia sp. COWG]|uniref:phosphonate C-P lyase system protein PhnH n=1 Tax=Agreia sp. COWG TaxID=2773266 RepID=UPI001926441B|nr:phosphonate C-P lyase system protein PhnH [Agreia sp. COWG]CAD6010979.1 PhnH protein [Agreia sp. COWG]
MNRGPDGATSPRTPAIPAPGFADPARDSQRAFRAILDALAHPARRFALDGPAGAPDALGAGLGAVALTVLDEDCAVWLGGRLGENSEVAAWLAFHTGVRIVAAAADADFVFSDFGSMPPLASLRQGSEEAPHGSATVVLDVRGPDGDSSEVASTAAAFDYVARGPGIDGSTTFAATWADDRFGEQWSRNVALFPRGVDLLLVDERAIEALPRTTRLTAQNGA